MHHNSLTRLRGSGRPPAMCSKSRYNRNSEVGDTWQQVGKAREPLGVAAQRLVSPQCGVDWPAQPYLKLAQTISLRASEEIKNNEPGFSQYMRERYGVKEDAA
jgi:hypothetical protein